MVPPEPANAPPPRFGERQDGSSREASGRAASAPGRRPPAAIAEWTPQRPANTQDRPPPPLYAGGAGGGPSAAFLTQVISQEVVPEGNADPRRRYAAGAAAYEETMARGEIILGPAYPPLRAL